MPDARKFRVLHLITKLELGGAQRNTLYTVENLDSGRWEKVLVAGPGGILDTETEQGTSYETVFLASLVRSIHPWKDFRALVELVRMFKDGKPDILHTHSSKAGVLGRLAGWIAKVPVVIHTVHGFSFSPHHPWLVRVAYKLAERMVAPLTTHFFCVSRNNLDQGLRLGLWEESEVSVVRSGIDIRKYATPTREAHEVRREIGLPEGAGIVGSVGNFKPQKAPLDLVRTFAAVAEHRPDAHLVVAGDGPLRPAVEQLAARLGLEGRIHLLGWRRDVPDLLETFDVFLLMSRWEGLPRSVLQARAAGVPVVATAVDGTAEAIDHGRTGFLVEPGKCDIAAGHVVELLENGQLRATMGSRAREGLEEFDIDAMVKRQDEIYRSLLALEGVH